MTQPARRGRRNPEIAQAIQAERASTDVELDTELEFALDAADAVGEEEETAGAPVTDSAYTRVKVQHEFEFVPGHTTRITYEFGDGLLEDETEAELAARIAITTNNRLLQVADDFEARLEERRQERKQRRISVNND